MKTRETLELLRAYESRNITFMAADGSWPIVWERASGVHVWDADGKKYLDLTAAFGVAATGHANPRVVKAGQRQMAKLLHAMGDVHPHALKAQLARELSRITFERWQAKSKVHSPESKVAGLPTATKGKTILCNSGFEAVEAALKTALLATGRAGVIAFEGGYHGLGYGALNATHRAHFRAPFRSQLGEFGRFVPFPKAGRAARVDRHPGAAAVRDRRNGWPTLERIESQLQRLFRREGIGAVLVEPIQVRGGMNIPPPGFLPLLRRVCDEHHALLILDEIYTGFGRTGRWFACEHSGTVPDVICLGKALTGGFPLSACVGRAELMDAAWPSSSGEAIHTSTFLGHPVGCAMALAQIKEIKARKLVEGSATLGEVLLASLSALAARPASLGVVPRGVGLLGGVEVCLPDGSPATEAALKLVKTMLQRGFILLPEGEHANVIGFTPPLTISPNQLNAAVAALGELLPSPMKLTEMKQVLAARDIQLTKSLGQNFLHDANQLRRMVAAAELKRTDRVLEVGPGLGPLTEMLMEQVGEVLAIEKDGRLVEVLRQRFQTEAGGAPVLRLVHEDVLDYLSRERSDWSEWKLVANLPYSVASPILVELAQWPGAGATSGADTAPEDGARGDARPPEKLAPSLLQARGPERMVATLQLEVGKRLLAKPGAVDYGVLTLLIQLNYNLQAWFKIPASCFFPEPDVDSACVCLVRREPLPLADGQRLAYVQLVKRGFSQRRKMMFKLLKEDWPEQRLAQAFERLNLSPQIRAEEVALEQFTQLARFLSGHLIRRSSGR